MKSYSNGKPNTIPGLKGETIMSPNSIAILPHTIRMWFLLMAAPKMHSCSSVSMIST